VGQKAKLLAQHIERDHEPTTGRFYKRITFGMNGIHHELHPAQAWQITSRREGETSRIIGGPLFDSAHGSGTASCARGAARATTSSRPVRFDLAYSKLQPYCPTDPVTNQRRLRRHPRPEGTVSQPFQRFKKGSSVSSGGMTSTSRRVPTMSKLVIDKAMNHSLRNGSAVIGQ